MRRGRLVVRAAWVAVLAGAASAGLVVALLLHIVGGPNEETVVPLVVAISLAALAAFVAAIPASREPRWRPVALEGVELALVSIAVLALFAFVFYVVVGPGYS